MTPLCAALLVGRVALTNGAFPDSLAVLLPEGEPLSLAAGTNFGLLVSTDGGANWDYVCEEAIGPLASLYLVGPAPSHTLFAQTLTGLVRSDDGGCTFTPVPGVGASATDLFPDPTDATRVFLIAAYAQSPTDSRQAIYLSTDGGLTFSAPVYVAPQGASLTGVEVARSAPWRVFASMYGSAPLKPYLVVSDDGGMSFGEVLLDSELGVVVPRLAAVDADDPDRVYLRLLDGSARDRLALYDHQSGTTRVTLTLDYSMSAFLRRADGAVLVGERDRTVLISEDGGETFAPLLGSPHARALGERDGMVYVVADDVRDGFALGQSDDGGAHWQPLLHFRDLRGPRACGELPTVCADPYLRLRQTLGLDAQEPDPRPKKSSGCEALPPSTGALALLLWQLTRRSHTSPARRSSQI